MSTCISCGDTIPEGRQVCWRCEHHTNQPVFSDILQANRYCVWRGWENYWIRRDASGYTCHEIKGDKHE